MGLLPIPAPRLTQGASRAGFWRAAALSKGKLSPSHSCRLAMNHDPTAYLRTSPLSLFFK